ncbi:MAG: hypothetical protein ACT4P2_04730 [Pseudomonadota bacterium]
MLTLDRAAGRLADAGGRRFDPASRTWRPGAAVAGERVDPRAAVRWLQNESGARLRVPVGVIGPRQASPEQLAAAEAIGRGLAEMGLTVLCGGRQGVMEAVCRGAAAADGLSVGLLAEADAGAANPFLGVALATGIGEARNALIARAAFCLIAVGDSLGTLSEVALGLQFGKAVLGLAGAARLSGVRTVEGADAALDAVAALVLDLSG